MFHELTSLCQIDSNICRRMVLSVNHYEFIDGEYLIYVENDDEVIAFPCHG